MGIDPELGLRPILNVSGGAVTRLGGAPMPAAVLDAFVAAAGDWVLLDELQAAASRVLAEVTGAGTGWVGSRPVPRRR
jgi:L-seryl-tRNA(Ser) seleniumtransferase